MTTEGMVFSEFDESVHVIDRHSLPTMKWYFEAQDWGLQQIWGVDAAHHMYLIHEVYQPAPPNLPRRGT